MMVQMGLETSGSDYSSSMLEVAKNNLSSLDKNIKLPPIEVVVEREDFTRVYVKEYDDRFQTIHILD